MLQPRVPENHSSVEQYISFIFNCYEGVTACKGTGCLNCFRQASEFILIQKQPLLELLMIFLQLQTVDLCLPYRVWGMSLGLKGDFWALSNCIYELISIVMLLTLSFTYL